ncbi:hypothetical protein NDU88_006214 [Pleurodeles waltl]|uniref:Uncharacterized protein n=1 Tax=Pleurodeles waltl TaxID=8319 RepID=A0AAV7X0J0_PLEWA|nr:hypothetical protein NDU88_006214 [Pleurodeles waltl]
MERSLPEQQGDETADRQHLPRARLTPKWQNGWRRIEHARAFAARTKIRREAGAIRERPPRNRSVEPAAESGPGCRRPQIGDKVRSPPGRLMAGAA